MAAVLPGHIHTNGKSISMIISLVLLSTCANVVAIVE